MSSTTTRKKDAIVVQSDPDIPYQNYITFYDMESAASLRRLHRNFYGVYYVMNILAIGFSVASSFVSTPNAFAVSDASEDRNFNQRVLSLVSFFTGLQAAILIATIHVSKLNLCAFDCLNAATLLEYYLTTQRSMPVHVFEKIGATNTLCFKISRPKSAMTGVQAGDSQPRARAPVQPQPPPRSQIQQVPLVPRAQMRQLPPPPS
jgi:hypothetical protein